MKTRTCVQPRALSDESLYNDDSTEEHDKTKEELAIGDSQGFKCPKCDRTLATKQSLKEHIYTHTGTKPFKCMESGCGQSFRQSSQLCNHKKVHKEAKMIKIRQALKKQNGGKRPETAAESRKFMTTLESRDELAIILPSITHPQLGVVLPKFSMINH